jgi:ABC-type branched-subunit amino acid transport system ATPase component
VSKAFLGLRALTKVSFKVREREILGPMGPKGAGKATLFNVLNGFLVPERGEVRSLGEAMTGLRPSSLCQVPARPHESLRVLGVAGLGVN